MIFNLLIDLIYQCVDFSDSVNKKAFHCEII